MNASAISSLSRGPTVRASRPKTLLQTHNALPPQSASYVANQPTEKKAPTPPHFPIILPGETFASFRIVRKLGTGGMGAVYLALHQTYGFVALKISSLDLTMEAFAHALARGRGYKGLVDGLEQGTAMFGSYGKYHYLAIKYVPGPTLAKLLNHDKETFKPLPQGRATRITQKIALAAGELHRAGLVHADIKPSNMIMKNREEIALFDYGLAEKYPTLVNPGSTLRGTPIYMAPEQWRCESLDPRADVFAIGVILWEMLTGQRREPTRESLLVPPLPSSFSPKLRAIVAKATAQDREGRYADGHELAQALAELQIA